MTITASCKELGITPRTYNNICIELNKDSVAKEKPKKAKPKKKKPIKEQKGGGEVEENENKVELNNNQNVTNEERKLRLTANKQRAHQENRTNVREV
jgi:hypothetical protein